MISLTNKEKYVSNLIERYKPLIDTLVNCFISNARLNFNKKITWPFIQKRSGNNVIVVDRELLNNDHYLISSLKELSKKDRKTVILNAAEGVCDAVRINEVEDRL
jgi:hypothetical protein